MSEAPLAESDLRTLISVSARLGFEIQLLKLLNLILQGAGDLRDSPKGSVLLHDRARTDAPARHRPRCVTS
jgi:hypothetical protein